MTISWQKILAVVGGLVVLAGVAYGIWWFKLDGNYKNYNSDDNRICCGGQVSSATEENIAGWKTYRNEKYGFEFKHPAQWRTNFGPEDISFIESFFNMAMATVSYDEMTSRYQGKQVLDLWFQNPEFDQKPILEEKYSEASQYYQYSAYNSAPQGIFLYVWEGGRYYDPSEEQAQIKAGTRRGAVLGGMPAYRITHPASDDFPLPVWYNEAIEVKKSGNLYLVFYAGEKYESTFDQFISTFKFTEP